METKSFDHHISIRLNNRQYQRLKYMLLIENRTLSDLIRTMIIEYKPMMDLK